MERSRWAGGRPVTSRPPIRMCPADTLSNPAIRRRVVDLPQPEGPSKTVKWPCGASKLTPSTALVSSHSLLTFSTAIADTHPSRRCPTLRFGLNGFSEVMLPRPDGPGKARAGSAREVFETVAAAIGPGSPGSAAR